MGFSDCISMEEPPVILRESKMKASKLRLSWRVGLPMTRQDAAFEELRALLLKHREIVQEVAFFETVSHHLYLPLDFFRDVADVLRRRIATLKADGIPGVGINVLTTIGHVNEGWDIFPPLPFQPMVGHDGSVSKSCACPNTPGMRHYVAEKYAIFAEAAPDFIWVDDDIRMQHHGVAFACFCPTCLDIFAQTTGSELDREGLVRELNSPDGRAVREAWISQNARSIESLLALVGKAIHAVNPAIRTGLMTAGVEWGAYSGNEMERWFRALKASKARPGGGFYEDSTPMDMVWKAFSVSRQLALLPDEVADRQYELENFPCSPLGKAAAVTVTECTLALAAGCDGIAFNALGGDASKAGLAQKEPLMRCVAEARPFWEELVTQTQGVPLCGFWQPMHPRLMARRSVREGEDWFGYSPMYDSVSNSLARLGIPLCQRNPAEGVLLSGRMAELFEDDELREMLAGAVIMYAFALESLARRGLGELTGVRLAGWVDNGVAERLTDDPLNGAIAGNLRDIRAEFWSDPYLRSARLEPLAAGVRVLSVLETYLGERRDACVTAFENPLGGRVVVMGHAPWRFVEVKRPQILNAADWAMRGALPVRIRETVPVVPFARLSADRKRGAIVLLNAGLDAIPEMTVDVRAPAASVRLASPGREPVSLNAKKEANGWSAVLRDIAPWQVMALFLG